MGSGGRFGFIGTKASDDADRKSKATITLVTAFKGFTPFPYQILACGGEHNG